LRTQSALSQPKDGRLIAFPIRSGKKRSAIGIVGNPTSSVLRRNALHLRLLRVFCF
jgi:hypothetical protein